MREICDRYDILLCADEVITGFGRLGAWFASERYDIRPDLITSAKGLSSAHATIGALIASDRVMEPFLEGHRMYAHGITFGGHPVQAAIALKNIEIMKRERIVEHVAEKQDTFRETLEPLLDLPIVGDLRGTGFFYALELVKDKRDARDVLQRGVRDAPARLPLAAALRGWADLPGRRPWRPRRPDLASPGRGPAGVRRDRRHARRGPRRRPAGRSATSRALARAAMKAMVLTAPGEPLRAEELATPEPGPGQVAIAVDACGVCRTDLHVVDGELPDPKLPLVPGHQIVGRVVETGEGAGRFAAGDRVGVPWLGWTCGECRYCTTGRENLCDRARFTGYQLDGGYAERAVADERFCFPVPDGYPDLQAAPLLCAGLIGYRALRLAGEAERLGLYGFGASAHIVTQVARREGRRVFAFTRAGTKPRRPSRGSSARSGRATPSARGPRSSTRRSSSLPPASSSRPRWRRWPRAGRSSAPAST